jgi:hypothetical protein
MSAGAQRRKEHVVSKRHQANRRKSFSRRQHELRERADRHGVPEVRDIAWDEPPGGAPADGFAFFEPHTARIRFALGD